MKKNLFRKILSAALGGLMAISLVPAAAVGAATGDSAVIGNNANGIYNANLYSYVLRHYDANKDGKLTVGEAKNVTEIYIVNEKVTSLKGLRYFPNLTKLTVQNCGLSSVHSDLGSATKLQTLNLSYNKISALPNSIQNLKNLVTVDLSGNRFAGFPTRAKYWTKVTSLDLSGNKLTKVPGSVPYMKKLTNLNLSNNQITSLPSGLKYLTSLVTLDMSNNKITGLSATALKKLTKLQNLYLQNNALPKITASIMYLTNLRTLNLANNKITSVSGYIYKCSKLSVLDLSNNNLSTLTSYVSKLTNLTKLNLANNKLSTLPNLTKLKKLKCTSTDLYALNLCGNKLSQATIKAKTNRSYLDSAWVKRQTTKTFVPVASITGKDFMAVGDSTVELSSLFTVNPSNATNQTVKYSVDEVRGVKASVNGSKLTITKLSGTDTIRYVTVKVMSVDGSNQSDIIFITVL